MGEETCQASPLPRATLPELRDWEGGHASLNPPPELCSQGDPPVLFPAPDSDSYFTPPSTPTETASTLLPGPGPHRDAQDAQAELGNSPPASPSGSYITADGDSWASSPSCSVSLQAPAEGLDVPSGWGFSPPGSVADERELPPAGTPDTSSPESSLSADSSSSWGQESHFFELDFLANDPMIPASLLPFQGSLIFQVEAVEVTPLPPEEEQEEQAEEGEEEAPSPSGDLAGQGEDDSTFASSLQSLSDLSITEGMDEAFAFRDDTSAASSDPDSASYAGGDDERLYSGEPHAQPTALLRDSPGEAASWGPEPTLGVSEGEVGRAAKSQEPISDITGVGPAPGQVSAAAMAPHVPQKAPGLTAVTPRDWAAEAGSTMGPAPVATITPQSLEEGDGAALGLEPPTSKGEAGLDSLQNLKEETGQGFAAAGSPEPQPGEVEPAVSLPLQDAGLPTGQGSEPQASPEPQPELDLMASLPLQDAGLPSGQGSAPEASPEPQPEELDLTASLPLQDAGLPTGQGSAREASPEPQPEELALTASLPLQDAGLPSGQGSAPEAGPEPQPEEVDLTASLPLQDAGLPSGQGSDPEAGPEPQPEELDLTASLPLQDAGLPSGQGSAPETGPERQPEEVDLMAPLPLQDAGLPSVQGSASETSPEHQPEEVDLTASLSLQDAGLPSGQGSASEASPEPQPEEMDLTASPPLQDAGLPSGQELASEASPEPQSEEVDLTASLPLQDAGLPSSQGPAPKASPQALQADTGYTLGTEPMATTAQQKGGKTLELRPAPEKRDPDHTGGSDSLALDQIHLGGLEPAADARIPLDGDACPSKPATETPNTPEPATEAPDTPEPATEAPDTPEPAAEAPGTPEPATEAPGPPEPDSSGEEVAKGLLAPEQGACPDARGHGGDGAEPSSPLKEAPGAENQGRGVLKAVVCSPEPCPAASLEAGQVGPPSPVEEGRAALGPRLPVAVASEAGLGSCPESPSGAVPRLGGSCPKDPALALPLPSRQTEPVRGLHSGEQARAALGVLSSSPPQPPQSPLGGLPGAPQASIQGAESSAPGVLMQTVPPPAAPPAPCPCQVPGEELGESAEPLGSLGLPPPRARAQRAVAALSGTKNPPGAGQVSLPPHSPLLSPKAAPKGATHAKDLASRISPPCQVPPGSGLRSPAGPRGLPAAKQQDDQDSLEEGEGDPGWSSVLSWGLQGAGTPPPGAEPALLAPRPLSRRRRPPSHLPCPQTRRRPRAPASTRTATGSRRPSWRNRTSRDRGPRSAQPRCPTAGGTYSPGRAPRPTLGCSDPSVPQAPAGGGSEETVTKVKQSRSEKKARKVGWGPAGTLPPAPGGTRLASNPSTQDWGWLR
uniref:NAC-A/B domain-containing protein n=1 Tax=Monodon monoceros TaxID=40151 RepID=A0A8C6BIH4_MONMO